MTHIQRQAFANLEGDAYFQRNREREEVPTYRRKEVSFVTSWLKPGDTLVEVGCGNGVNLADIRRHVACEAVGVEPSTAAVQDGRRRWPDLSLHVGTADALPLPDHSADVLWFGFCLYLVDRSLLMRVVAEADRVLKPESLLAITDFTVHRPVKRAYVHREGLYSWKMDYPGLFTANPAYALTEKIMRHRHGSMSDQPEAPEVATWILTRSNRGAYGEEQP